MKNNETECYINFTKKNQKQNQFFIFLILNKLCHQVTTKDINS